MPNFTPLLKSLKYHICKQEFNCKQKEISLDKVAEIYTTYLKGAVHSKTFGEYYDKVRAQDYKIL